MVHRWVRYFRWLGFKHIDALLTAHQIKTFKNAFNYRFLFWGHGGQSIENSQCKKKKKETMVALTNLHQLNISNRNWNHHNLDKSNTCWSARFQFNSIFFQSTHTHTPLLLSVRMLARCRHSHTRARFQDQYQQTSCIKRH